MDKGHERGSPALVDARHLVVGEDAGEVDVEADESSTSGCDARSESMAPAPIDHQPLWMSRMSD
jgi:hypothetical protein